MSPRVDGGHHGNVGREDDLLRRFQADHQLEATGVLDAATAKALREAQPEAARAKGGKR